MTVRINSSNSKTNFYPDLDHSRTLLKVCRELMPALGLIDRFILEN